MCRPSLPFFLFALDTLFSLLVVSFITVYRERSG
jgi:hypothetical protein